MATTADYLNQLQLDKKTLVNNLVAKGVEASNDETFTTLAPKVAEISTGGDGAKIHDASGLFYSGYRLDKFDETMELIADDCVKYISMFYQSGSKLKEAPYFKINDGADVSYLYRDCFSLTKGNPLMDFSKAKNVTELYYGCNQITEIPSHDFSSSTSLASLCYNCKALISVGLLKCGLNNQGASNIFRNCTQLVNVGGLENLGSGYTWKSTNFSSYKLDLSDCTLLTHDSLMNIINNLYDLNIAYDVANGGTLYTQSLVIAIECQSLLSDDEIAIATNKGWNVSFA